MNPPAYIQEYFRIRRTDAEELNDAFDAGDPAENVSATIGTGIDFRIRFKVRETAGNAGTVLFKLQANRNTLGWNDVDVNLGVTTICAMARLTSQTWVDGAATSTELLTSTSTFDNSGEGFEDNTMNANINLASTECELEWCLRLESFFDGAVQNVASDTIDFRVVVSDGTAFVGTYTNPTITVAETAGFVGGTMVENPGRIGPFGDTNGNLYYIMEPAESDPKFLMVKSTDGGDTWREMDSANRPTTTDLESVDCQAVTDTLHITHDGGGTVEYHRFRMSDHATLPDTWEITDESVVATKTETDQACCIAVRSDTTIICAYRRTAAASEHLYYKIRSSGGTWGSELDLDSTASTAYTAAQCVVGASDKVHFIYKDETNSTLYHKSLTSGDTLGSREAVETDAKQPGSGVYWSMSEVIYWDDAGEENVMVLVHDDTDDLLYSVMVKNDASPETRKVASANTVMSDRNTSRQPSCTLAVDGTDAHLLYGNIADEDMYHDTAANDAGWGTDTEQHDAIRMAMVRAFVFTHSSGNGGATVLGYVWDDDLSDTLGGGTGGQWYGELELAAAGTDVSDSQSAYLKGSANTSDNQSAYMAGSLNVSDSQPAYLTATLPSAFIQEYFRIRKTDDQGLNAAFDAGDPAENVNTTINTGDRFRIRLKARETAAGITTHSFVLQCRHPEGENVWRTLPTSWTGVANQVPAFINTSAQYADGAATSTRLLTNVSTYVNGEGDEQVQTAGNAVGSYTLTSQESEFEYCITLNAFYSSIAETTQYQIVASDTVEFRLVEDDSTVFTGTYTNPIITVAEGPGFIGTTSVETPNNIGPFIDGNGNLYFFCEESEGINKLMALKSTDGGDTWREMDKANRSAQGDLEGADVFHNTVLGRFHIAHGTAKAVYHEFNDSTAASNPDTWVLTNETIDSAHTGHTTQKLALVVRGTTSYTVVATYTDDAAPARVRYRIRSTGGTWGGENTLDSEASTDFICPVFVYDGSTIYIFYKDDTNGILYFRTLSSADSLSGRTSVATGLAVAGSGDDAPARIGKYYDDGGVAVIVIAYQKALNGVLYSRYLRDGTLQTEATATDDAVHTDWADSNQPHYDLAVDGKLVYLVYNNDTLSDNFYLAKNDDEAGWGTDTLFQTVDPVAQYIFTNIFTHSPANGGAKVLGYFYEIRNDGGSGSLRYAEVELSADASDSQAAFLAGTDTALDNQAAYLAGSLDASDSQSAYTSGILGASDNQAAFLAGTATASDAQPAYLAGSLAASDSAQAYLAGGLDVSDNQSAYLAGTATALDNQAAYLAGGLDVLDNQAAFLAGSLDILDNQAAFLAGGLDVASSRLAFLAGTDTALDNQAAYLAGGLDAVDSQAAFLSGIATALDSQAAFLSGTDTALDNQPAYLVGGLDVASSQPAYIEGAGTSSQDNQAAFLAGTATALDSQAAFLAGSLDVADSQAAFLAGTDTALDNQAAFLAGTATALDNQAAFLAGALPAAGSQAAFLAGVDTASSAQAAYLDVTTFFPFTEDFSAGSDGDPWRLSHWTIDSA